jgi:uncharacterized protein YciI
MAQPPRVTWQELTDRAREYGLLVKRLYVIMSEPTAGVGPVMEHLDAHLSYQHDLELAGSMFAAGPLASADEQEWRGDGLFVYRAESQAEATRLAEADPMHISGARRFSIRQWMLNEGSFSVQLFYSSDKPRIL